MNEEKDCLNYTGKCPPEYISTGGSQLYQPDSTPASASKRGLIEDWYIAPLKRMDGNQAFVCLSVCLFLYEKYLRKTNQINQDANFAKGNKVFKQIGRDLEISEADAFEFWRCWRNGLAHHGMPKNSTKYHWGMNGKQESLITICEKTFTVNPWLIRDKILNKIDNKKHIWNDDPAPLMQVFRIMSP